MPGVPLSRAPRRAVLFARILLSFGAALALVAPAAPARAADTFAFSAPQTSSKFNQGIDFSIRLTASAAPDHVDLEVTSPGAIGPQLVTLPDNPAAGTSTLHYALDTTGDGHIMPNTPLTYDWVAYPSGGGAPVRSAATTYLYADDTQNWTSLKNGIVTVHWTQGPQSFGQRASDIAVKAIDSMASQLGITETKPVDFFIYADDASFRAALGAGARTNVGGEAITDIRTLIAEFTPGILNDPWVGITITHELTHQVIADATDNPFRSLPRWLNEGTAVYESEGNTASYRSQLASAVASGEWWPLTSLDWQFPTDPQKTSLAYAESVSAVDYLVKTYGRDALNNLILAYKTGPTDDEALQGVIGKDLATFQQDWYTSLGATPPSPLGPQPAPSGPLPPDWAAAASPAPGASASAPGAAAPPALASTPLPGAPAGPGGSASSSGGDLTLVLAAVVVVAGAVLAGIVLASRRTGSP